MHCAYSYSQEPFLKLKHVIHEKLSSVSSIPAKVTFYAHKCLHGRNYTTEVTLGTTKNRKDTRIFKMYY